HISDYRALLISSFLGIKKGLKKYKVNKSNYKYKIDSKVKKVRPYAVAAVIKNIKLTDETINSLMQLQEKLHITHGRNRRKVAMGVHDLDKIKFPLTYTTKPPSFKFIPLDFNKEFSLHEILEIHPKGKEFAHLLKGFREYPIWLDANNNVLSMPPIINSDLTKITSETKNLFLDITGTDRFAVEQALNILVCACADRNGKIFKVNQYPDLTPKKIKIDFSYINKILGLNLKSLEVKRLLERMGMTLQGSNVLYPAYRTDILNQIDMEEDIAITYGYEKFKPEIPNISTIAEESKFEVFKQKIANLMIGLELQEVSTLHLTDKETQTSLMLNNSEVIQVENSKSSEYDTLRSWLIPSLLHVLKNNKHNEYPQMIFEIGNIFNKNGEFTRLCVMISHSDSNYTEARQILDSLSSNLNIKFSYRETEFPSFIPGRMARVSYKNKDIAYIGEIHPKVLSNYSLENPVACFELNLTELFEFL
ncbi:MAG: phenylalanine--tRNA ligase subunit beta, partial [Nanoarchaeota archaeon]